MSPPIVCDSGTLPLSRSQLKQRLRLQGGQKNRERARWFRQQFRGGTSDLRVTDVRLIGQESCEGITYFRLRLQGVVGQGSTIGEWDVLHRYSEFDKLRNELGVRDRRVGSIFPEKTGLREKIGLSACAGWRVDQRMVLLQSWLDGLVAEISSGGDGGHAILPLFRSHKLAVLHRFFGLDGEGQLLPNATLVPYSPVANLVPFLPDATLLPSAPPSTPKSSVALQSIEEDAQLQAALAASVASPGVQRKVVQVSEDPPQVHPVLASTAPSADGLTEVVSDDEDAELQAALAASVVHLRQQEAHLLGEKNTQLQAAKEASRAAQIEEENARIRSDLHLAEAVKKSEEEHRLSIDAEFKRGMSLLQANVANQEEQEKDEERKEKLARSREEEHARCTVVADSQSQALQEVTVNTEQKQSCRLEDEEQEEDHARNIVADEHDAKCKSDTEEAQRKAEEAATSWLQRAMDAAALARQFEDQGEHHPALDHYRKSVAMFTIALKKEQSEKVRSAIQQKMADFVFRANHLSDSMMAADAAEAAAILAGSAPVGVSWQATPALSERSLASPLPLSGKDDNAASLEHRALISEA